MLLTVFCPQIDIKPLYDQADFGHILILFSDDGSKGKGLSEGVIAGISLGMVFLVTLVLVAIWYVRHRNKYYQGKSISYYKDMSTKPLEEDFDDEEATKIFGSREKVEFA